jgi:TetR/AcrR family transcriptional regulator, transcriptional repressor for nem operon
MLVFWQQGYEATSVDDLLKATGLARQSLYNTFGDKKELFITALEHYRKQQGSRMLELLTNAPSVKVGFARLFQHVIEESLGDKRCKGCLMVNTATELAPHDPTIRALVDAAEAHKEEVFTKALERAQATGELKPHHDPKALAQFLYNAILGLRVRARHKPKRETLEHVAQLTLSLL